MAPRSARFLGAGRPPPEEPPQARRTRSIRPREDPPAPSPPPQDGERARQVHNVPSYVSDRVWARSGRGGGVPKERV